MGVGVLNPIEAGRTIGEIAANVPGATAVFRKYKLDFCCGGDVPLEQAAKKKNLDTQQLLSELEALRHESDEGVQWPDASTLIDHILERYHEVHRQQLPELIRMARRVEAVHADHPHVPAGLADVLTDMEQELLSHMAKEEQVLFPVLKSGGHPMVIHPIGMMRHEHLDHGETLERLTEMTNDFQPPMGACNTWRALFTGLAQLRDDLMSHIHLENNVLFPAFEGTEQSA